MKVCICLGSVIDVNIRSDQTVMEAKGVIGVSQGTNPSSIKLIYKGHLLQNNHHCTIMVDMVLLFNEKASTMTRLSTWSLVKLRIPNIKR